MGYECGEYHETKLTEFLDPRQAYILQSLVNRHPDVIVRWEGGSSDAERKRGWWLRIIETSQMRIWN